MLRYVNYVFAILKAHILRRRTPILVVVCVTNRCNLRCRYCYCDYYDRNHPEMGKTEILDLIDELAHMGTKYLSINGGEALLRDDLEEIIDKARSKRMLLHLSTNGLLIEKRLSLLRKIDSLAVSIDGIGPANDQNRGEGSYVKIRAGLDLLKKEGIPFHTHTVLTKNNKGSVEAVLNLAKEYGTKAQFSILREIDSPDKTIILSDEENREIVSRLLDYKRKGHPVFFSIKAYQMFLQWPKSLAEAFSTKALDGLRTPCYLKRFACQIEASGLVYPCIVLVNKSPALNFREVGFKKAWQYLSDNPCSACHNVCSNDLNLIFSLNPISFLNANRVVLGRLLKKKV